MTQTNGMAQEMPTLASMLEAVEKIESEKYKAPTEYKIHPDDWDELRTQLKPHMAAIAQNGAISVVGLRIVLDYTAARLPRKVPNLKVTGAPPTEHGEGNDD